MKTRRSALPWLDLGLIGLGAGLLILIFPSFGIAWLAWIALVPLLLVIKRRSGALGAFLCALAVGSLFYCRLLWWATEMEGFHPVNCAFFVFGNAIYFGVFGLAAHVFERRIPSWNVLSFPTLWVLLEFVRSNLSFLAFPWGGLGYSQYEILPVAQIASFSGVYGVSFLIAAVNTTFAEFAHLWLSSRRTGVPRPRPATALATLTGIGAGVLLLAPAWLARGAPAVNDHDRVLKVALVQADVYHFASRDPERARAIFANYLDLSRAAARDAPELIVWPSSSVPGALPADSRLMHSLARLAEETGVFLLVGSSGYDKQLLAKKDRRRFANSAFLFSPEGRLVGRYDKIRLLPFDEYLPLRDFVRWPSWLVSDFESVTDAKRGEERTIFRANGARFAAPICWENLFPGTFRQLAAQDVDFMVSMTNESFTDSRTAREQMLAINAFRAIENDLAVVRVATTGVSAIIEPSGRITARVEDEHGRDLNVAGFRVAEIPLSSSRTLYNRYGHWLVYLLSAVLIGLLVLAFVPGRPQPGDRGGELS